MKLYLLLAFVLLINVTYAADSTEVTTPTWVVRFTPHGQFNLPSYSFYLISAPTDVYVISLHQLYEAINKEPIDKDESSVIQLRDWNWALSEVLLDNKTSNYIFTITGTATNATDRAQSIQITNTLSSNNLTNSSNVQCQFRIYIEEYRFIDEFAQLVLSLSLQHSSKNDTLKVEQPSKRTVKLNKAYVQTESFATKYPTSKKQGERSSVTISLIVDDDFTGGGSTKKVLFVYEAWKGSLSHSAVFGLGTPEKDSGTNMLLMGFCIGGVILLAILGAIAHVVIKRHKHHYMLIAQESIQKTS